MSSSQPALQQQQQQRQIASGILRAHAVRLLPGDDLVPALESVALQCMERAQSPSCFVMTAVGSLSHVTLRLANAVADQENPIQTWKECLEVVSLVGTFSKQTGKHLHMSVSNAKGETFGGHLMGGTVWTTLELVLGTMDGVAFARDMDETTGYRELVVSATHADKTNKE